MVNINSRRLFNAHYFPYSEDLLFVVQVFVILIVVITSVVNLSCENGNLQMWTALLSSSLGYILPNPKLEAQSKRHQETDLVDIPVGDGGDKSLPNNSTE